MNLKRLVFISFIALGCKNEPESQARLPLTEAIVVISNKAPDSYRHYMIQDSVGELLEDPTGPYTIVNKAVFTYLDAQNNLSHWQPKTNALDTLVIPFYKDYLELTTQHSFTDLPQSFL